MLPETFKSKKYQETESSETTLKGASPKRISGKPKNYHTEITAKTLHLQLAKKMDRSLSDLTFFEDNQRIKNLKKVLKSVQKLCIVDWSLQPLPQLLKDLPFFQVIRTVRPDSSKITDETLDKIGKCLKRLRFLKEIEFIFYRCERITDIGLQSLSKGVKRFASIENMTLKFPWGEKITSAGLDYLSKSFKRLITLRRVSLDFRFCDYFTDKGLQDLATYLKGLGRLQRISFLVMYCKGITGKELCSFCETIEKISSLQRIRICCPGGENTFLIEERKIIEIFTKNSSLQLKESSWQSLLFDKKKESAEK